MKKLPNLLSLQNDLHPTWRKILGGEFKKKYIKDLWAFLESEKNLGKIIYPPVPNWFEVFKKTSFNDILIIILGQDPYRSEDQAHGLSFSVKDTIKIPASLQNIFRELTNDINMPKPDHGCLNSWSEQGILLLNNVLTVEKSLPGSHQNIGWEIFTNKVITELSARKKNLVFMLWGRNAQKKAGLINSCKHLVLKTSHPSPLSSYRGFFGCKHFSEANEYIYKNHLKRVNWAISSNF